MHDISPVHGGMLDGQKAHSRNLIFKSNVATLFHMATPGLALIEFYWCSWPEIHIYMLKLLFSKN